MSIVDRAGAGPAPNFAQNFNPLIFRDGLRVSPWPMMPGTTTSGFPRTSPRASMGTQHADAPDETDAQVMTQYTAINPPDGNFPPSLFSATDLIFCTHQPQRASGAAVQRKSLSSACSPVHGFTLSMANAFLRQQHRSALALVDSLVPPSGGLSIRERLTRALYPAAPRGGGATQRISEFDAIDFYLRLALNPREVLEEDAAAAAPPNALSERQKIELHYLFPRGVVRRLTYMGISMAQSNQLYSPGPPQVSSMSADDGQTLLNVGYSGPLIVRDFWGASVGNHLWLLVKPYTPPDHAGSGDDFPPVQIVPYCSRNLSADVPIAEGLYTSRTLPSVVDGQAANNPNWMKDLRQFKLEWVGGSVQPSEAERDKLVAALMEAGSADRAQFIYVGKVLAITGRSTISTETRQRAAGLTVPPNTDGLSVAFTSCEMLPLLTVSVSQRPWGSYVLSCN